MELAAGAAPVHWERWWVHSHFTVRGPAAEGRRSSGDAMEHISLYRKWRPQAFTEVVGQRHVTNTLSNALSSGRLVHAYLFAGPRGTGKTSTARILAKAINCVEGPTATPCNVCDACVSISEGTALDVIEIDAASNRKIDEIRELLEKIPYTPTALRSKVYIIDEVHQLTSEASSALLKTLEEPPGHVVFVLATTEPHKLLPTIVSRCQRFDFSLVSARDVARLLQHIAQSEGIDIEDEALDMIAENAHGSVRDAIGVMDQISNLSGERVTREELAELLGEVETDLVFSMVDMIAERDTPGALSLVGRMVEDGKDPRRFVESLLAHLRSLFLIQNASHPDEIVEATSDHFQKLSEQSDLLTRHEVIKLMERFGEAHREMRWNENPRLVLEYAIVKNTSLDADVSLEGLAFRIEELEKKLEALSSAGPAETPPGPSGGARSAKAQAKTEEKTAGRRKKPPRAPEEEAAPASPVPGPEPEPALPQVGGSQREKVRRTWMAVLAELKKMGRMKLYALLTKARVQEAGSGKLVLAFPADALFQMEVLADSAEDISAIEETWARFAEEQVKVSLVSQSGPGLPRARPAQKPTPGPAPDPPPVPEPPAQAAHEQVVDPPKEKPSGSKKPSSKEVAEMLKERFDGEIVNEEPDKE